MVAVGTLRAMYGAEEGDVSFVAAVGVVTGTPNFFGSIASPSEMTGAFHYFIPSSSIFQATIAFPLGWGSGGAADTAGISDGHLLVGFRLKTTSNVTPDELHGLCRVLDTGDNELFRLEWQTDGTIDLIDNAGTTLASISALEVGTEYYFEVAFEHAASGAWELWLDGTSIDSGSTGDFFVTSEQPLYIEIGRPNVTDVPAGIKFDDIYVVSHSSTLQGNNLGPSEVFAYQSGVNSQTADSGLTTNDDIINSAWLQAGETPLNSTNFTAYTGSPADGARIFDDNRATANDGHKRGPVAGGDDAGYDVTGTIQGAMWLGVYQRGTGGGSSHVQWYGEGSQSPINSYTMDAIANSVDTFRAVVSEDAGPVPTASQSFAMGAGTTGAQDIEIREQWAFLLHTPSAGLDVDLTVASIAATAVALGIALGNLDVSLTVAALTATATALGITADTSVPLTVAALTATPTNLTITLGNVDVTLPVASVTAAAVNFGITLGNLDVDLTVSSIAATATTLGITLDFSTPLTIAALTVTPIDLAITLGNLDVALTVTSIVATAVDFGLAFGNADVALPVALITTTATALGITLGPVSTNLIVSSLAATATALGITLGNLDVALTVAAITATATTLDVSQGFALPVATITAIATTLGVTLGNLDVALPVASITATAVDLGISQGFALTIATITATAVDLGITLGPISTNLTVSTIAVTATALGITLGSLGVSLTVSSIAATATALGITLGDVDVSLTIAVINAIAVDLGVTSGALNISLTVASITAIPIALGTTLGPVVEDLTVASIAATATVLGITVSPISRALISAAIVASAVDLGVVLGTLSVPLTVASITVTAVSLGVELGGVSPALAPALITTIVVDLVAELAGDTVALIPAVVAVVAVSLNRVGGVTDNALIHGDSAPNRMRSSGPRMNDGAGRMRGL